MNPKPQREGEIEKILERLKLFFVIRISRQIEWQSKYNCDDVLAFLRKELSSLIREERKDIKEAIVKFAIQGGFDRDEMKGLARYTRILKYFYDVENLEKK